MRRIAILAVDHCQGLDVIGPLEVFHGANAALARKGSRRAAYEAIVVGVRRAPIPTESGLRLLPEASLAALTRRGAPPLDTFILAGGPGVEQAVARPATLAAIRRCAAAARRTASVCTGAFLLAASGLLDGRRATTHWAYCDTLARHFPSVSVERDPIYVRDRCVWTTAGVTAGIDLALAMVADDFGQELASELARWLVVFIRRAGGQPQVSAQLAAQAAQRPELRDLLTWISEHLDHDLSLPVLARRSAMSVRNFARVFREETGTTPARYVETIRIEAARRYLEGSDKSVEEVAAAAGFASAEALRRAFAKHLGTSPSEYRARVAAAKAKSGLSRRREGALVSERPLRSHAAR
jgi:transcriptional regulator GlxA family with amidase domain